MPRPGKAVGLSGRILEKTCRLAYSAFACILLFGACTESAMVPTIQVMPGRGKSFWSFYDDRTVCRQFADQAVRDQTQGANLRVTGFATPATVLGAGPSTTIGKAQGASTGAPGGAGLGTVQSPNAQSVQTQFDNVFGQCMFSLGNSVPGMGPMTTPQ